MHKKSSRHRSRRDLSRRRRREHEEPSVSSCSRSLSSHPATGFYSDLTETSLSHSISSRSYTKKIVEEDGERSETEEYNSFDEYQVDFPAVQLKLPRRRRCEALDRRTVYDELPSYGSEYSSPRTESEFYETYNSQQRFQSLGNIFTSVFGFFQNNPNMTRFLLGILLCYVVVCNLEILIPKVISMIVRFCYPWARYWTVVAEQLFTAIANMFTRMDAVIYATYCEFAAKYCRSRRLMCDVTCSFVDHVLSQSRPHLAPIPHD